MNQRLSMNQHRGSELYVSSYILQWYILHSYKIKCQFQTNIHYKATTSQRKKKNNQNKMPLSRKKKALDELGKITD